MGRKSSIEALAPEIVEAVQQAIRDGRTIDDIVETIQSMGGEASRSAVGRYRQRFTDVAEKMRQAQEVAKVWVDQVGKAPEGELGRLVTEMIRTVAFKATMDATEEVVAAEPMDIMLLSKAMQHLAQSDRITSELTLKLRRQVAAEAAERAEQSMGEIAAEQGMTAAQRQAALKRIREDVYGIVEG